MIEYYLKVLMDNIFVFGNSSKVCLTYLGAVPECCHKKKIAPKLKKKCHFKVKKAIVLDHIVSSKGMKQTQKKSSLFPKY